MQSGAQTRDSVQWRDARKAANCFFETIAVARSRSAAQNFHFKSKHQEKEQVLQTKMFFFLIETVYRYLDAMFHLAL